MKNLTDELITYQLCMIGKKMEDIKNDPVWYSTNTFNKTQAEEFKKYAIGVIKKSEKCSLKLAKAKFMWFDLMYGLKVI